MTFDLTFDHTFGDVVFSLVSPTPPAADCRQPGVLLTWLSYRGWNYWLFEGYSQTDTEVVSAGTFRRAGTTFSTGRESRRIVTCRTRGLLREWADLVSSVAESVSVYALAIDADGRYQAVPVRIPEGRYPVWNDRAGSLNFAVEIEFPARKSQRR